MKKKLAITWRTIDGQTEYFMDKQSAGFDDTGFSNILKYISASTGINHVIIQYPAASNTGGDPHKDFPFYSSLDQFKKIISGKNISTEYEPLF